MALRAGGMLPDGGFTTVPLQPLTPPQPKPAPVQPAPKTPDVEVIPVVPGVKTPAPQPGETYISLPAVGSSKPPIVIATAPAVPATPTQVIAPPPIVGQPLPGSTPAPAPTPTPTPSTPAPAQPSVPTDAVPPPDMSTGGDGDFASAQELAAANRPDLAALPSWQIEDPLAERALEVANPPLKGGSALNVIVNACVKYGIDARACVADALHEGAGGDIGDDGTSYGPFQLHEGGSLPASLSGKGKNNVKVNAWAWSENGIEYAVRSMAVAIPSAAGLQAHAAVYAIVYGFERPSDRRAAYNTRAKEYDHLVALGAGWASYAADLLKGPTAGGATDTGLGSKPTAAGTGPPGTQKPPAGVQAGWGGIIDFFSQSVPQRQDAVHSFADSLVNVFKGG